MVVRLQTLCWQSCSNSFSSVVVLKLEYSVARAEVPRIWVGMPRTKSLPLKCVSSNNGQSKTWVLVLHDDLLKADDGKEGTPVIVKLRHPRSGAGAIFLFSHDNSVVQEVFSLSEKRSWFINDSVREHGNLHFSTPVDPMFLILPYLKKSKEEEKVVPLEDLLIDNLFPDTLRILKSCASNSLHLLADRKGPEDLNAWTYNEEKAIKWLCRKTEKVAEVLKEKQINVGGSATSKNFVKSVREDSSDSDKELYLKYAHGLVSEYLTDDLSSKLSLSLGVKEDSPEKKKTNKRKSSPTNEQENVKKMKAKEEAVEMPKVEKPKSVSNKEKLMMKAASGSKSITSFFKKK